MKVPQHLNQLLISLTLFFSLFSPLVAPNFLHLSTPELFQLCYFLVLMTSSLQCQHKNRNSEIKNRSKLIKHWEDSVLTQMSW